MTNYDLFSEIETQAPTMEAPVKVTVKTPERPHKDRHTQAALKTISWKFKDQLSQFPELKGRDRKITSPSDLFEMFHDLFYKETREMFVVFWLSSSNRVIGYEIVSIGNLNSSIVHPREVFRGAIVASCANIILAHNHPSENPAPSNEDIVVTRKIIEAGKILDINVFDHMIFAGNEYTSFVEKRLI